MGRDHGGDEGGGDEGGIAVLAVQSEVPGLAIEGATVVLAAGVQDQAGVVGGGVAEGGGAAEGDEEGSRRKKPRRKKRPLYPKGFDPENPSAFPKPDPERWLPKRERSTFRQRKKDKRAGISRGPQGSATGAATVDARATTNITFMSEEQKEKLKAEQEAVAREAAAAAGAAAAAARRKGKKGKGAKW